MTQLFNRKNELEKRRLLRKNTTEAEKRVWMNLRKRQIGNERFLRQFSIKHFVLDFYCPRLRLVVEIDGGYHFADEKIIQYDLERQEYIESLGIEFLRFKNDQVFEKLDEVMRVIKVKVKKMQLLNES